MAKLFTFLVILFLGLSAATAHFIFGYDFLPASEGVESNIHPQPERLKTDVSALFNTPDPRGVQHLESLNLAAEYITGEWKKMGLAVEEQGFVASGIEYKNLVVSFGPRTGPRLIVGAHYDVCEEESAQARGADDNASGVAGLLELSRLLVESKVSLPSRLDLVAYTLEEPPHFAQPTMGSLVHARSLRQSGTEVYGMISLEMLGYYSEQENSQKFPLAFLRYIYPSTGNFLMIAGSLPSTEFNQKIRHSFKSASTLPTFSLSAPDFVRGIQFSDNRSYTAFGYPAVMLTDTAFYRNGNYHKGTDTPSTLNYVKMAEVVKGLYQFVIRN